MIDKTVVIHPNSKIDKDVSIGPYSIIGQDVSIKSGTVIGSHVVIKGPTTIGPNNRIFHFASIGDDPQDKKFNQDNDSSLIIGSGNTIREYVSIHRGTTAGGGKTFVGNDNWIMAYVHIAHDCIIGNNNTFANNAAMAGHVTVNDFVTFGGFTVVHQFCRIGSYSFTGMGTVILRDIPPYILISGKTAKPAGLNREGLKRNGFDSDKIKLLKKAYKIIYRDGHSLTYALNELKKISGELKEIEVLHSFISSSERGIIR
tara:strand:- start:278 stop:1051 length:774 start_codon:yes stop_codon:yes gene_type:complete